MLSMGAIFAIQCIFTCFTKNNITEEGTVLILHKLKTIIQHTAPKIKVHDPFLLARRPA